MALDINGKYRAIINAGSNASFYHSQPYHWVREAAECLAILRPRVSRLRVVAIHHGRVAKALDGIVVPTFGFAVPEDMTEHRDIRVPAVHVQCSDGPPCLMIEFHPLAETQAKR